MACLRKTETTSQNLQFKNEVEKHLAYITQSLSQNRVLGLLKKRYEKQLARKHEMKKVITPDIDVKIRAAIEEGV